MPSRTIIGTPVQKGETFTYSAVVRDEAGVVVDLTDALLVATGTVTVYHKSTNVAINGRNGQDILGTPADDVYPGANEHTITSLGVLTWKAEAADTTVTGSTDQQMVARYTFTYDDADAVPRVAIHEIEFTVQILPTVTNPA